jgi:hypothetical protein
MRLRRVAVGLLLAAGLGPAVAGVTCSEAPPTPESVRKGLRLALQVFGALNESGESVALIGRVGADLSKYRLRFSHMGMVVRDHRKGRWTVVHLLNQCGTAKSALYDEGLGNFFNDDPFAYEALVVFPGAENQQRLLKMLSTTLPSGLFEPTYNMLSYPWSTKYQNSNQWVIEMLAAAWAPEGSVSSRQQAQAWLKQSGYQPTLLRIGTFERLGGRMFRANIAFDDHPNELRYSDQIYTATVESAAEFVKRLDPKARTLVVKLQETPEPNIAAPQTPRPAAPVSSPAPNRRTEATPAAAPMPPAALVPPAAPAKDLYTEILKLDELRKRGLLTDAEFDAQKKKLLDAK